MMRLNRRQKTVGNLLGCALLCLLLYVLMGCPPLTVRGMTARIQRDYLLPELEPLYVERRTQYHGEVLKTRLTFVIAQAGEEYAAFQYQTHLLRSGPDIFREVHIQKEALCTARSGMLYVASEKLKEADSAVAVVAADPPSNSEAAHWPEGGRYSLEGVREAEQVFIFPFFGTGLTTAVSYRDTPDTVPVTVTLYDGSGAELDTLALEVSAHELTSIR